VFPVGQGFKPISFRANAVPWLAQLTDDYVGEVYDDIDVRADLSAAHERVWAHVTSPGDWWTGAQRREIASLALAAFARSDAGTPDEPATDAMYRGQLPVGLAGAISRMTTHAHTLSESWYRQLIAGGLSELEYVEVCGVVSSVAAVASLCRSLGATLPELPRAQVGQPRRPSLELARSPRNWVPVATPAGTRAPVVEAYTAAPGEYDLLFDHLAPAQYMSSDEMSDLAWTRGTLSRPQTELVAGRISSLRQCFF
jgi:alkylhydroperoxidase family enzyme